jgi:hypothetical protein
MKLLKKLAAATAVSFAVMGAAHADTVLNNWVLNPTGTGGAAAGQEIRQYLDINGNALIQIAATGGNTFSFKESGVFSSVQADGMSSNLFPVDFGRAITAKFSAVGSGTFSDGFSFSSGTISIYSSGPKAYGTTAGIYGADQGTLIATFNILAGGGGQVDASGAPTTNGQVTVRAQATSWLLLQGRRYRPVDHRSVVVRIYQRQHLHQCKQHADQRSRLPVCELRRCLRFGLSEYQHGLLRQQQRSVQAG